MYTLCSTSGAAAVIADLQSIIKLICKMYR